jgi:hypothetical protein
LKLTSTASAGTVTAVIASAADKMAIHFFIAFP